jgi:hypothetical protein
MACFLFTYLQFSPKTAHSSWNNTAVGAILTVTPWLGNVSLIKYIYKLYMAVEIMAQREGFSVPFFSCRYLCHPVQLHIAQVCPDTFKMLLFLSSSLDESAPEN